MGVPSAPASRQERASGTWTITGTDGTTTATTTLTLRITAKAQVPSPALVLPTRLATPGCTVIVPATVRTNAGQTVAVTVTGGTTTAGDQRPAYRVIRGTGGKVTICTTGYTSALVRVTFSAPAVPGYTGYYRSKLYPVPTTR